MSITGAMDYIAGLRSDAVLNATGRDWRGWFSVLDQAGARQMPQPEVRRYLAEQEGLTGWWSRMVSTGYAQMRAGAVETSGRETVAIRVERTFPVPAGVLFRAWADEGLRGRWLPGQRLLIRKAVPDQTLRITWDDGRSGVTVQFTETGGGICRMSIRHIFLGEADQAADKQKFWTEALDRLERVVA